MNAATEDSAAVEPVDPVRKGSSSAEGDESSETESILKSVLVRLFGSGKIHSALYTRDISNVTREVIDRLAGTVLQLNVQATKPDSFDEPKARIIGKNVRVLGLDPSSGLEKNGE